MMRKETMHPQGGASVANKRESVGVGEIARRTHLSRSTVFRALNNCGAVDEETKTAVMQAAAEVGYTPPRARREGWRDERPLVGVVLPTNPQYFWGEAMRGMKQAQAAFPDMRLVFSLYTELGREQDTLFCLDYMESLRPDLLVITPSATPAIRERLAAMAGDIPIVCFNETADIAFCFYVGADVYADGVRLARASAPTLRRHPRLLSIEGAVLPMVSRRDEGFRQELASLAPEVRWVGAVDIRPLSGATLSAGIARILADRYAGRFDAVYVSLGVIAPVCLALHKLRKLQDIAVVGYEDPRRAASHVAGARIAAYLEQDMMAQGYRCIEAVHAYLFEGRLPPDRRIYAPSSLRLCEGGT